MAQRGKDTGSVISKFIAEFAKIALAPSKEITI